MLSILIEKSAKVQHMASAIGEPRPIVADEMPGKFGNMPTHFFESSWGALCVEIKASPCLVF